MLGAVGWACVNGSRIDLFDEHSFHAELLLRRYSMNSILRTVGKVTLFIAATAVTAAITAVISALVMGQPLAGLSKLNGLYEAVVRSTVPAWIFALVVAFAVFALYYAVRHRSSRKPKGRIHFIPDGFNSGWAKQHDNEMSISIGGTFTYDGPDGLIILKAFLEGTAPSNFDATLLLADGPSLSTAYSQLMLLRGEPVQAVLNLRLSPNIGTPSQTLRRTMFFRDNFKRDFSLGKVELFYRGA